MKSAASDFVRLILDKADPIEEEDDETLEMAQLALDRGEDETALDLAEDYLESNPLV